MNKQFDYDVIIAGGGPAGSSAAIHLATRGARVLLAEQKRFPRAKLCGEFISPECALHFERLGVSDEMRAAHPAALTATVFYARSGRNVRVPSSWFGASGVALGLSRAEMDERLLRRAANAGAHVRAGCARVRSRRRPRDARSRLSEPTRSFHVERCKGEGAMAGGLIGRFR